LSAQIPATLLIAVLLQFGSVAAGDAPMFPLPNPSDIGTEQFEKRLNQFIIAQGYQGWHHDDKVRPTGPFIVSENGEAKSYGTHGPGGVKLYYSPQVWVWMTRGGGEIIPDGSIIIKEIYDRDPQNLEKFKSEPSAYSVMVRDSKGSWDGWFWSDGGPLQKPKPADAERFFDPNAGFGLACMNCHASAVNGSYSSLRNVTGNPIKYLTVIPSMQPRGKLDVKLGIHGVAEKATPVKFAPSRKPLRWNANETDPGFVPPSLPLTAHDHVVQGPQPNGRKQFISSDQCMACHDATQTFSSLPNMTLSENGKTVNLSPYGEWRYSMMGLSARDPVFLAQLEAERAIHPELSKEIDNNCLSCHAVMGQRQWGFDHGNQALFTHEILSATGENDPKNAGYGALGREGVSCVVCHRMLPEGLGTPETYSGDFKLSDNAVEVFGPYEKVVTVPMEQSLGLTPRYAEHLRDSKLCATCHTVQTPILDAKRRYSAEEFKRIVGRNNPPAPPSQTGEERNLFHEQMTFVEWKNSAFSWGRNRKNCQDCHMPTDYRGAQLKFKIANIEDETYPFVENRLPDDKIALTVRGSDWREPYSRHSLHGINLFVTEMFNQFPPLLGVPRKDALIPGSEAASGFDIATENGLELARVKTAKIEIAELKRTESGISAEVKITNLTGHKFPTGVAFRRAFIEFRVLSGDKTLWVSGATDESGVIGTYADGKFTALPTEFFERNQYQRHHTAINSPDQVQIFEELITDSEGDITTSFMSYKTRIKDNRIPPFGWAASGPDAVMTQAAGVGDDSHYSDGQGTSVVRYEVPLKNNIAEPISVVATLYYQSIPPYYLRDRFKYAAQPASKNLLYFVNQLNTENGPLKDWKLEIAADRKETR
jgi:hypothetical protein